MNWQTVAQNWPAFFDRIEQRWPQTDESDLIDIDGDRRRFTSYLSKVHDLTRNEANEEIEAWLMGEVPADVRMDDHRDNANIRESGRDIPTGEDVYSEDGRFGSGQYNSDDVTPTPPPIGRKS